MESKKTNKKTNKQKKTDTKKLIYKAEIDLQRKQTRLLKGIGGGEIN